MATIIASDDTGDAGMSGVQERFRGKPVKTTKPDAWKRLGTEPTPVAWRWRQGGGEWYLTPREPSSVQPLDVEVEPLYLKAESQT